MGSDDAAKLAKYRKLLAEGVIDGAEFQTLTARLSIAIEGDRDVTAADHSVAVGGGVGGDVVMPGGQKTETGVSIGDVEGDITGSTIAGRDVEQTDITFNQPGQNVETQVNVAGDVVIAVTDAFWQQHRSLRTRLSAEELREATQSYGQIATVPLTSHRETILSKVQFEILCALCVLCGEIGFSTRRRETTGFQGVRQPAGGLATPLSGLEEREKSAIMRPELRSLRLCW